MKSMSFKDKFEKQVAESINSNEEVRDAVNGVVESRFDRVLEELRLDREESERKWADYREERKVNDRKWEEAHSLLKEHQPRVERNSRKSISDSWKKWPQSRLI